MNEEEINKKLTEPFDGEKYELDVIGAMKIMQEFEHLGFGPVTERAWIGTAKAFIEIVGTKEKGEWLARRILQTCARFPKPVEMRRIYAHYYPPADGLEPHLMDSSDDMKLPGTKSHDEG